LELEACFVVIDIAGQKLAYVYFEEELGGRSAATIWQDSMIRIFRFASAALGKGFAVRLWHTF
jgi:hypothetical protein